MPDTSSGSTTETPSREDLLRQMSFLEHLEELRKCLGTERPHLLDEVQAAPVGN